MRDIDKVKFFREGERRAHQYLNTDYLYVSTKPFGTVFTKCNYIPADRRERVSRGGLEIPLRGRVLHERVAMLFDDVPIRSHQETSSEVAMNIGDTEVAYETPDGQIILAPSGAIRSVNGQEGFYHGFRIRKSDGGLLYVAKVLFKGFVEENSFRAPRNTYR